MNESWLESWVFTSSQASEEAVHYITYIWKTTYSNSNQVFLKFCSIEFFLTLFFYLFKKYFWPGRGEPVGWRWVDTEYPMKCRISTEIVTMWWRNHIVLINIVYYIADIWIKLSVFLYYFENTMFDLNWLR